MIKFVKRSSCDYLCDLYPIENYGMQNIYIYILCYTCKKKLCYIKKIHLYVQIRKLFEIITI